MVFLNIILLNLLWFASVLGASNNLLWPAVVFLILLLSVSYIYVGFTKLDLRIILFSLLTGILLDGFLMSHEMVIYNSKFHELIYLPPFWILILWIGFGASIKTGLQWLARKPVIGGIFMLIGAPISYLSAEKLNAVTVPELWPAMVVIGAGWLLYFSLVVLLIKQKKVMSDALA